MKKKYLIHIIYITIILALAVSLIFIIATNSKSDMSDFEIYYQNKSLSYTMQNLNASEGQIVFVGDSLTDGYKLDKHYADLDLAVYNRGIGGDTTFGVLGRMGVSIYDIKPSKVVLLIGGNDVNGGVEPDIIIENSLKIVSEIKENLPETEIYFVSMIPQNNDIKIYGDFSAEVHVAKIMEINAEIEKALKNEKNVTYIDLFSLLKDENNLLVKEYSTDGLHLTENGYEIWTNALKDYLR
jgi:lysophospholipase L1-like esterase